MCLLPAGGAVPRHPFNLATNERTHDTAHQCVCDGRIDITALDVIGYEIVNVFVTRNPDKLKHISHRAGGAIRIRS